MSFRIVMTKYTEIRFNAVVFPFFVFNNFSRILYSKNAQKKDSEYNFCLPHYFPYYMVLVRYSKNVLFLYLETPWQVLCNGEVLVRDKNSYTQWNIQSKHRMENFCT